MNEDNVSNAMNDIKKVLDKLDLQAQNDPDEDKMFVMAVELTTTDGMIELSFLSVTVKEDYLPDHVKEKPLIISIEVEIDHELEVDQIIKVLDLINLINRQAIVGHFLVHLGQKKVLLRRDIPLLKGRLSRVELEWSINQLLDTASFYYKLIMERISSDETLDEMSKRHWVNSSYLHRECRL